MKVGIIGLPNAGKSTLFNALTLAGAQAAEYPFTTVEPNIAVVPVPDPRLDRIADALGIEKRVPEHVEFVDIAGLVRGAHEGEGLGNRFLGHIRDVDAILHVVRSFKSPNVAHPHGDVDPVADLEAVETELLLADLQSAERRLETVGKAARGGDKAALGEQALLQQAVDALAAGRPAPAGTDLLTSKPTLVVANVDEGEHLPGKLADRAALAVSAAWEAELAGVADDEAAEMRGELGLEEGALEAVASAAYRLLDLVTFFTAVGGTEARARSLPRGGTALDAAGKVHTDMRDGFVRAEVVAWEDLVACGSFSKARESAKLRVEGRDYVVVDGDVLTIKHRT